ncbi:MAG: hypothetical protein ICV54_30705 [Nostoc sp. C3-bin3]|nr:hypothetical protein [Nostoc sp. C3-bin3]
MIELLVLALAHYSLAKLFPIKSKAFLGNEPLVLCLDETGDEKKGKATDYVAKHYIGNLGRTANGIVDGLRLCSSR